MQQKTEIESFWGRRITYHNLILIPASLIAIFFTDAVRINVNILFPLLLGYDLSRVNLQGLEVGRRQFQLFVAIVVATAVVVAISGAGGCSRC